MVLKIKNPKNKNLFDFGDDVAAGKGQPNILSPAQYPEGMMGVIITGDASKVMDIFAKLGDVDQIFNILRNLKNDGVEFADGWRF